MILLISSGTFLVASGSKINKHQHMVLAQSVMLKEIGCEERLTRSSMLLVRRDTLSTFHKLKEGIACIHGSVPPRIFCTFSRQCRRTVKVGCISFRRIRAVRSIFVYVTST